MKGGIDDIKASFYHLDDAYEWAPIKFDECHIVNRDTWKIEWRQDVF